MSKTTIILLTLVLNLALEPSYAASCDLNTLSERLARDFVTANFVQEKKIKVLKRPLKSNGQMLFLKNKGLIWQVQVPIKATTLLEETGITQFDSSEQRVDVAQGQASTVSSELSSIFLNLMTANFNQLEPHFLTELSCEQDSSSWQLKLIPKQAPLADFFKSIQLTGKDYIDQIHINESNGDSTTLSLTFNFKDADNGLEQYFAK